MPYCRKCGAEMSENDSFCAACGNAEKGEASKSTAPASASAPNDKTLAILAVIFPILFFLPLVAGEKTPFGRFWANQALLLFLLGVISGITSRIFIGAIVGGFCFFFWIVAIVYVCKGEMKPLPLIGQINIIK